MCVRERERETMRRLEDVLRKSRAAHRKAVLAVGGGVGALTVGRPSGGFDGREEGWCCVVLGALQ